MPPEQDPDAPARVVPAVPVGREATDAELVTRALRGDRWAEEMLYRRHVDFVAGLCTRLLCHAADAEDAVQDAFVDALEQLDSLERPELFRRWLARIAVHKAHRRLRRRKLHRWLGLHGSALQEVLLGYASDCASPEQLAELKHLDRVLGGMPDDERVAWQLRHVEGYRLEDVAELCRCSLSTVKRRINQADVAIREHVNLEQVSHE